MTGHQETGTRPSDPGSGKRGTVFVTWLVIAVVVTSRTGSSCGIGGCGWRPSQDGGRGMTNGGRKRRRGAGSEGNLITSHSGRVKRLPLFWRITKCDSFQLFLPSELRPMNGQKWVNEWGSNEDEDERLSFPEILELWVAGCGWLFSLTFQLIHLSLTVKWWWAVVDGERAKKVAGKRERGMREGEESNASKSSLPLSGKLYTHEESDPGTTLSSRNMSWKSTSCSGDVTRDHRYFCPRDRVNDRGASEEGTCMLQVVADVGRRLWRHTHIHFRWLFGLFTLTSLSLSHAYYSSDEGRPVKNRLWIRIRVCIVRWFQSLYWRMRQDAGSEGERNKERESCFPTSFLLIPPCLTTLTLLHLSSFPPFPTFSFFHSSPLTSFSFLLSSFPSNKCHQIWSLWNEVSFTFQPYEVLV